MTRNLTHLVATAVLLVPLATLSAHAPHDVANMVQVSPNFAQDRTVIAVVGLTEHALIAKSTDGGMTWIHMGRAVAENKVTSIDFSPAYATDQTIFIATATKGIYRSTDGGIQWSTTNAGLRSLHVLDLAISPAYATDQTLLAATEAGLFRSGDRGQTWVKTAIGLPNTTVSIVAYGESPLVVFAGTTWLCRSVDGGVTWTPMVNFQRPISSIAVSEHFLSDFTLAVSFGKSEGRGVKVSTDGGTSFFTMLDGLTSPYVNDIAIADNGIFFAVSEEGACYRARNAYGAWTLYDEGFEKMASQTDSHYFSVVVSPNFSLDGTVLVGGHEGLFLSSDHGEHWKQSDLYHQRINRFLEFSPDFASDGELLMGNYGGGPIRFNHTLNSWEALATGLTSLWCGALEFSPTYAIDDTIFYGYYGTWRSTDRGMTWKKIFDPQSVTRAFAISPKFCLGWRPFHECRGRPCERDGEVDGRG